ncbi:MAG: hypothetical protein IT337_15195 [Thermomicrobiales bacterium]|nr:hypothetical protein [Thermomicrobiales bacterium]
MSSDVTGGATVYYTHHHGAYVPIYDGAAWAMQSFASELSLALDADTGHSGYQAANFNYDIFAAMNTGSLVIGTCVNAWLSDTARNTGVGHSELETFGGLRVNKNSISLRIGSGAADTLAVAARQATLLGTMRASANGQCSMQMRPAAAAGGTANKLFLCNAYNRETIAAICRDSTDSWSYTTDTFRAANGSAANAISFVMSLPGATIQANYTAVVSHSAGGVAARVGIGYDSTTTPDVPNSNTTTGIGLRINVDGKFLRTVGDIGLHSLTALEASQASGTMTWNGDNSVPTAVQMVLGAHLPV